MGRPRRARRPKLLTDVELELMSTLWQIEEGTVRDVMARLPRGRELAYTSVSTVLRILEDKKLVRTRRQGRGHLYRPAITKSEYESRSVRNLVDKVFEGAPSAMVMRLLDDEELTLDELEKIRRLFEEKLQ